jgi:hypothetical protein
MVPAGPGSSHYLRGGGPAAKKIMKGDWNCGLSDSAREGRQRVPQVRWGEGFAGGVSNGSWTLSRLTYIGDRERW